MKRLFFVAPVAAAALSLSAVTAFANEPPKPGSVDCVALSNQLASQKAKLGQDQNTLNLARNELVNVQAANDRDAENQASNKIVNVQGAVQQDQASVQQTQSQTTNQNVCSSTPAASSSPTPAPKASSTPSGSGQGNGSQGRPSDSKHKPQGPTYNCVAISNEVAAQQAKLEQDQSTLNAARNDLANAQPAGDRAAENRANNVIANVQGAIQKDQASISQNQTQSTTQNVCDTTTTNNYYTTHTSSSSGSGSGAGAGAPSGSGSGSGSAAPGLPQTGAAA